MAKVIWTCDGCGKEAPGIFGAHGCESHKPTSWYARRDDDGVQVACSRECIDHISAASGKTNLVLPI